MPKFLNAILGDPVIRSGGVWVIPKHGAASVDTIGSPTPTATGTLTLKSAALTTLYTRIRGCEYLVTVAATTAVAGFRLADPYMVRGNAAGVGGFACEITWGPATGVATTTNRAFVGLTVATAAPTDVQPSSLVDMIGMGWDAADANIQVMHNDGTSTATKVDLGASFPVPTADRTKVYRIRLWCDPNDTKINWEVKDVATGAVATGSATTDIPANTSYLAPRGWMSVGGTSSVIGIGLMGIHFIAEAPG